MDNIRDLLPFYALDALTPQENAAVETWLVDHPEGWDEIRELQIGVEAFAESVTPIEPSTAIKTNLMARIERERAPETAAPPVLLRKKIEPRASASSSPSPSSSWWQRLIEWVRGDGAMYATGLSFAAAALALVWGLSLMQASQSSRDEIAQLQATEQTLQSTVDEQTAKIALLEEGFNEFSDAIIELNNSRDALTEQLNESNQSVDKLNERLSEAETARAGLLSMVATLEDDNETLTGQLADLTSENEQLAEQVDEQATLIVQYIDPTSPQLQVFNVGGTEANEVANAHVLFEPESENALLLVSDLAPLTDEQTYQFWLIDDVPFSAGLFAIDENGTGGHAFGSDEFERFGAVGVSIEPAGGSDQPTGDIVLLGEL